MPAAGGDSAGEPIPLALTANHVDKHWVPCADGRRHAIFGRAVPHQSDHVLRGLCGATSTPSDWKFAPFRHPSCDDCLAVARDLQADGEK